MNHVQRRKMITEAINDKAIHATAALLILRLLVQEKREVFPLSHRQAGQLLGLIGRRNLYLRIGELVPRYLTRLGLKGIPATVHFSFSCPLKGSNENTSSPVGSDHQKKQDSHHGKKKGKV
jgi:hypothetical protein